MEQQSEKTADAAVGSSGPLEAKGFAGLAIRRRDEAHVTAPHRQGLCFSESDLARCTAAGEYNNLARLIITNNADSPDGGTGYTLDVYTDDGRGNGSLIVSLAFAEATC